ncbi:hypothetical protein MJO47_08195 [Desulfuromonas sp. KJ2020]|uniref:hypothetical protein n=1 Tax=Desulfuromonas sp. KJ2020 TaxID=2919173 RepID=UPI0020A74F2B|nr:hypothetical protein [Desulfuromonas sp. KJ2020]MCP3177083.1 hypothetical protein [Desulfuromonas sp. KJ2020]
MDPHTARLFAEQLARWTESHIHLGRSPLKKVEVFSSLLTSAGELSPPLIFWINRDSFMAAGVVLFPSGHTHDANDSGIHCAEALGLRHFISWAPKEVVIWEVQSGGCQKRKTLTLSGHGDEGEEAFRETLLLLLEEVKMLSVTGAIAPADLSPFYLVNLCLGAITSAFPFIAEQYLVTREAIRLGADPAALTTLAYHKATLTLLRLLALISYDRLPPSVQPEGLDRATIYAMETLPDILQQAMKPQSTEQPLPLEAATRFHHFFRRMLQLPQRKNHDFLTRVLQPLLAKDAPQLGGFPLPSENKPSSDTACLFIHPDGINKSTDEEVMEVASQPILAYTALLRNFLHIPPAIAQGTSVLRFLPPGAPNKVIGTLKDNRLPSMMERQELATLLRGSWPNRRLPLLAGTPLWGWEFIHLLGLAGDGASLELRIPDAWIYQDFGAPLFDLIKEYFVLTCIRAEGDNGLTISLQKTVDEDAQTTFELDKETRSINWSLLRSGHRSLLALGLRLPAYLFKWLETGTLQFVEPTHWPAEKEREIYLFAQSTLGQFLWSVIAGQTKLPSQKNLRQAILDQGLPLPGAEILQSLAPIPWREGEKIPRATIDSELALWMDNQSGQNLPKPLKRPARTRSSRRAKTTLPLTDLVASIGDVVFRDGIPLFPEQYLYDYYKPQLTPYKWQAPLRVSEVFFGQYTLRDDLGTILEVEGLETAKALVLISHTGRTETDLPQELQLTATLLERYIRDLRTLKDSLYQQVNRHMPNQQDAEDLAREIWSGQDLPPWDILEE